MPDPSVITGDFQAKISLGVLNATTAKLPLFTENPVREALLLL